MKTQQLPSYVKRYELGHGYFAQIDTALSRPMGTAYRPDGSVFAPRNIQRRTVAEVLSVLSEQVKGDQQ